MTQPGAIMKVGRWGIVLAWVLMAAGPGAAEVRYRLNQVGYAPFDAKTVLVDADRRLDGRGVSVRRAAGGEPVWSGRLEPAHPADPSELPLAFQYRLDLNRIQEPGRFRIELEGEAEGAFFSVGADGGGAMIESLLHFFRVQRCGDTRPVAHRACHLKDATNTSLNLTGGWHDAGDFLKFTRQIAYTTYLLLLSHAESPPDVRAARFRDDDGNGRADVLDEALIGLDYLVKCYPDESTFVVLVGNFDADHSQGTRMPEDDRLAAGNRPATAAFRRDDLAKFAYTMALAAAVLPSDERYPRLAARAYAKAKSTGTGEWDKLCLAATELYRSAGDPRFLEEARRFNDRLSASDFGNYSDNTNLAHARLALHYPQALNKLRQSVAGLSAASRQHPYGFPTQYSWGSLYVSLSAGSAASLYARLSGVRAYQDLPQNVRDYALGRNPWGICFISGQGATSSRYLHHNIAMALEARGRPAEAEAAMRGAVAEGPVLRVEWEKEFKRQAPAGKAGRALTQPLRCVYYDHPGDYMTNEPCIYGAAEAILFFSLWEAPRDTDWIPGHRPIEPSRGRP